MNLITDKQIQRPSDEAVRNALGRAFWKIADLYQFTQEEQAALLGVGYNRARLKTLRESHALPTSPDGLLRVSHLVAIHKSLRILFSRNRDAAYAWMKTPRSHLDGKSAIDFIVKGGSAMLTMPRLAAVRRFLERGRTE